MRSSLNFSVALLCTTVLSAVPASAKTLVWCSEASPEGFDMALSSASSTYDAGGRNVFDQLVRMAPGTTNPVPGLAESWEISDDGKEYIFHLRKGVKFHATDFFTPTRDLNADDVIFSFQRQIDPNNPWHDYVPGSTWIFSDAMGFPDLIQSIDRIDDLTVRFTLARPNATIIANLTMEPFSILSKEYADSLKAQGLMEDLNWKPVGTGPFMVIGYRQDAAIRYRANPDYWGGKPKVDNLVFSITPDASVRLQKLKAGECHMMPFPNVADIPAIEADPNLKVKGNPSQNLGYIGWHTNKPPLDRPQVRRALNMAIDKQAIIASVFQGQAVPGKTPIPPNMWSYNDAIEDDEYDLDKARTMLDEAGVKDLELKIWAMPVARPYMPNARRAAEIIQADLAKIGVKTKIVSYEWGEYLKRLNNPHWDGDAAFLGWTTDNGDPDNFLSLLSCDAVGTNNNPAEFCNTDFEALIQKARITSDRAERTRLYKHAQVIFKREAPWAVIDHSLEYIPMRKEVTGFVESPMGRHEFATVDLVE